MTTFALIAGMIPVALGHGEGADFRAPLGRAIIGGVITSTLLTLLVIPTFYDILAGWRDAMRRLFGRDKTQARRGARAGRGWRRRRLHAGPRPSASTRCAERSCERSEAAHDA